MMNITKGKLMADDWGDGLLEVMGEYWTSEAVADHNTVCVSCYGKLLSMDKAAFPDWLQLHSLLMWDEAPAAPYGPAFDPFDVGMDVE